MNYTTETPTETGYYWLSINKGVWRPVYLRVVMGSTYYHEIGETTDLNIDYHLDRGTHLRWIPIEKPNID